MNNPHNYRGILISFMSYNDNVRYGNDFEFTPAHLGEVTAGDVLAWFNFKAFGTDVPTDAHRPIHARANSLKHWKKAISYYMPNRNVPWDELNGRGNPTRSAGLNDMIRRVIRFEARGQGVPSQARRPLKQAEFRSVLAECQKHEDSDPIARYGIPALLTFQFHMIGRVDDCCKWRKENIDSHDLHPEKCAKARLSWSKNVTDERDAPWQHLFGCMDAIFCVLINLGLWLEIFHSRLPSARRRPFVFCFSEEVDNEERAGDQGKSTVYRILCPIFQMFGVEKIGSHSVRKLASTWVRSNGTTKDDKDHRGRWKSKRVSDGYDDVQLDYVDAKVAAVLCPGGVARYVVRDPACTDEWIATKVTPSIDLVFGRGLAVLLGTALLWLAHMPGQCLMPPAMVENICREYDAVKSIDRQNPVEKVLVSVTGNEAVVYIEDVMGFEDDSNPPNNSLPLPIAPPAVVTPQGTPQAPRRNDINGRSNQELLLGVMGSVNSLRRTMIEHGNAIEMLRSGVRKQERTMNSLVRKIDANPLQQLQRAAQGSVPRKEELVLPRRVGAITTNVIQTMTPMQFLWRILARFMCCGMSTFVESAITSLPSSSQLQSGEDPSIVTQDERMFGVLLKLL